MNEFPNPNKVIDIDLPKVAKKGLYLLCFHLSFYCCSFYIGRDYI